jgi:hypothetical protein
MKRYRICATHSPTCLEHINPEVIVFGSRTYNSRRSAQRAAARARRYVCVGKVWIIEVEE